MGELFLYGGLMAALLACSGFCSASETAFFHLSPRQAAAFGNSIHRIERLISSILRYPNQLLTTLLFSNMLVNTLFFSLSGVLTARIEEQYGAALAVCFAVIVFFVLLTFGEMLPKALAYVNANRFCRAAAIPCWFMIKILHPLLAGIDWVFVKPALLLAAPRSTKSGTESAISINQIKLLLDASARKGHLGHQQNQLLVEVLEMGFLKVRHIMRPRVEMIACSMTMDVPAAIGLMTQHRLIQIPCYDREIDTIVGMITLRDLLLKPQSPIREQLKPAIFLPEQKTVESLLSFFQEEKTDMAVAVDEYGGIAGAVYRDDVIERFWGEEEPLNDTQLIAPAGPMMYRLSARLAIRDWADAFGIDAEDVRLTTLGGFVLSLLGKIPRPGDTVRWRNMTFTVEQIKHNRLEMVLLTVDMLPGGLP